MTLKEQPKATKKSRHSDLHLVGKHAASIEHIGTSVSTAERVAPSFPDDLDPSFVGYSNFGSSLLELMERRKLATETDLGPAEDILEHLLSEQDCTIPLSMALPSATKSILFRMTYDFDVPDYRPDYFQSDCIFLVGASGDFLVNVCAPSALSKDMLRVRIENVYGTCSSVLRYCANKKIIVSCFCKFGDHNDILVRDIICAIIPVPNEGNRECTDLIKLCFDRSRMMAFDVCTDDDYVPPYIMRSDEELAAFYEACSDKLPKWVKKAYRKNLETAKEARSFSDEKKHAQKAIHYLLNIDWTPQFAFPTVKDVEQRLNESFYGLCEVKQRLLEIVAQVRRTALLPKWGLLIAGPPGVAKTTIAKTVADTFNMGLIRLDIPAVGTDSETVTGSSRVYSNAAPGTLLTQMYAQHSAAAVLLVNEIDKVKTSSTTDMLLAILDKTSFVEGFLEKEVPTDSLFCIATCNDIQKVSKPFRDRFLVINVSPYTPSDKKAIFQDYVLPRTLSKNKISSSELRVTEDAVDALVTEYALDPGARDLEQAAERIVGDYCLHADNSEECVAIYTSEKLRSLMGGSRKIVRCFTDNPGQTQGVFYYENRCHVFLLEASVTPGSGKFEVLGPIPETQKEYAKAAYLCVRNTISIDLSCKDVTVFVPQSLPDTSDNHLGMACYAAICSRLLNKALNMAGSCFLGGCDLNGSLYFDETNLEPLLRAVQAHDIKIVYAPVGTGQRLDSGGKDGSVFIIEAPNAETMFRIAMTTMKT